MRMGNVYISGQVFSLLLAVVLLLYALYAKIPLPYVSASELLFLAIVFLLMRAFVPDTYVGFFIGLIIFFVFIKIFFSLPFFSLLIVVVLLMLLIGMFAPR